MAEENLIKNMSLPEQFLYSVINNAEAEVASEDVVKGAADLILKAGDLTQFGLTPDQVPGVLKYAEKIKNDPAPALELMQKRLAVDKGPAPATEGVPPYLSPDALEPYGGLKPQTDIPGPVEEEDPIVPVKDLELFGSDPEYYDRTRAVPTPVFDEEPEPVPGEQSPTPEGAPVDKFKEPPSKIVGNEKVDRVTMDPNGDSTSIEGEDVLSVGSADKPFAAPPTKIDPGLIHTRPGYVQDPTESLADALTGGDAQSTTEFQRKANQKVEDPGISDKSKRTYEDLLAMGIQNIEKRRGKSDEDAFDKYKREMTDIEEKEFKQALISGIGQMAAGLVGFSPIGRVKGRVSPVGKYFTYKPRDFTEQKKNLSKLLGKDAGEEEFDKIVKLLGTSRDIRNIGTKTTGETGINLEGVTPEEQQRRLDKAALDRESAERRAKEKSGINITTNVGDKSEKTTNIDETLPETYDKFTGWLTGTPWDIDADADPRAKIAAVSVKINIAQQQSGTGLFSAYFQDRLEQFINENPEANGDELKKYARNLSRSPEAMADARQIYQKTKAGAKESTSTSTRTKGGADTPKPEKGTAAKPVPPKFDAPPEKPSAVGPPKPPKAETGGLKRGTAKGMKVVRVPDANNPGENIYHVTTPSGKKQIIGLGHKHYNNIKKHYQGQ